MDESPMQFVKWKNWIQKSAYHRIPFIWHSGLGKNTGTDQWLPEIRSKGWGSLQRGSPGQVFEVMELGWWLPDYMHSSKLRTERQKEWILQYVNFKWLKKKIGTNIQARERKGMCYQRRLLRNESQIPVRYWAQKVIEPKDASLATQNKWLFRGFRFF